MPVHDWTRVEAGIFHAFHVAWIPEIQKSLNGGLLPEGYYALAEQHAGRAVADILTLHASPRSAPLPAAGATPVAETPPRVRRKETVQPTALGRRRTPAIRHVNGHRLPEMPLFLQPDRYVNVPLEPTYEAAYRGMPAYWRDVLEGRLPQSP